MAGAGPRAGRGAKPEESGGPREASSECALCLDEFAPGEKVTRLFCFHAGLRELCYGPERSGFCITEAFHSDCLEPWLRRSETCPTCKRHLLEDMEPE